MTSQRQDRELVGRVAFVTGGGSGLGAAFCRRLAADGAHVIVNDLLPEAAGAVAAEIGGTVAPFDVTDAVAFDAAVDTTVRSTAGSTSSSTTPASHRCPIRPEPIGRWRTRCSGWKAGSPSWCRSTRPLVSPTPSGTE